jgi:hypothetical protein
MILRHTRCNVGDNYDVVFVGRDSSVGLVTRYGLDGPRIIFLVGRDIPHLFRPAFGPT